MRVEQELREEIEKWSEKLDSALRKLRAVDSKREKMFIENITAYFKDARYFFEKKDLVRAFECLIWAWAWVEIGKRLKIIEIEE